MTEKIENPVAPSKMGEDNTASDVLTPSVARILIRSSVFSLKDAVANL